MVGVLQLSLVFLHCCKQPVYIKNVFVRVKWGAIARQIIGLLPVAVVDAACCMSRVIFRVGGVELEGVEVDGHLVLTLTLWPQGVK